MENLYPAGSEDPKATPRPESRPLPFATDADKRNGEMVQILGTEEDFFGPDWRTGGPVNAEGSLNLKEDDEGDSTEQEEEEEEDFTKHSVHADGVPSCDVQLKAKDYKTPEFAAKLLNLLREDLAVDGWDELPASVPSSAMSIHKVSGSLTNAVFFVSCPSPAPEESSQSWAPAPTVLLRIYGPSSGSLISRKHELHLLHTLSAEYGIGPLVLGTFFNGRVEEYFESRALHKEEMRDARISRWIARRMRELHSVDVERVILPEDDSKTVSRKNSFQSDRSRSTSAERRPSLQSFKWKNGSTSSLLSTSSQSSNFSWSSTYSSGSDASSNLGISGKNFASSPSSLIPPSLTASGASESAGIRKKRARASKGSASSASLRKEKIKVGAWDNIRRWNREANKVLTDIAKLVSLPGVGHSTPTAPSPPEAAAATEVSPPDFAPFSSPKNLLRFKKLLDMPRFLQEAKAYREWVKGREKETGKSKRVFSHNDTQYGNLLIRRADEALLNERPHEQIMVIDFEYASANPRAFDIANHFHEWCADYHHSDLPHSLSSHGTYPTLAERRRFYRAYVGADMGYDGLATDDPRTPLISPFMAPSMTVEDISHLSLDDQRELEDEKGQGKDQGQGQKELSAGGATAAVREDTRVVRLEDEVRTWSPCSHAMWAVWGIVQAHDDIKVKIEEWENAARKGESQGVAGSAPAGNVEVGEAQKGLYRTRSGEVRTEEGELVMDDTPETHQIEFDYLSYSLERVALFRKALADLGVVVN